MLRGAELVRAILRAPNRYALLSLGSRDGRKIELGADGFLNYEDEEVRKCYMRLATQCHPDRCPDVPDSTKAFQALVRAYELACKPDLRANDSEDSRSEDEGEDEKQDHSDREAHGGSHQRPAHALEPQNKRASPDGAKQQRRRGKSESTRAESRAGRSTSNGSASQRKSNNGCFRTTVVCPRCSAPWGNHLRSEGQEHLYSALMQGRAQVHCLTCLLEFGCLTAGHGCPHCAKPFDYRPTLFNRKFTCGKMRADQVNIRGSKAKSTGGCGKRFGIMHFTSSATKVAETEAALQTAQRTAEQRARAAELRNARAARATKARWNDGNDSGGTDDDQGYDEQLGAFIVSEDCPYCGKQFSHGHAKHLASCKAKASRGKRPKGQAGTKRKKSSMRGFIVGAEENDGGYRPEKQGVPKRRKKSSNAAESKPKAKLQSNSKHKAGNSTRVNAQKKQTKPKKRKPRPAQRRSSTKSSSKRKQHKDSDEDFVVDDY